MAGERDERSPAPGSAHEALGMRPPSVRLARFANRLRNGVGTLHARMAPGFVLVLERMLGLVDNKALYTAVELGIPDLLAKESLTSLQIARALNGDADALDRLLRYLVCRDVFTTTPDGRYTNNAASETLTRDAPVQWRDWVLFFGSDWNNQIFGKFSQRITQGTPGAEAAFGMGFFDYINQSNPNAAKVFNSAMAAGARLQSLLFAETIDLSRYARVCDVGGGTGETMIQLLTANPQLDATVFDLPELEFTATQALRAAGVDHRARFTSGDFFKSVPTGYDLYTLFAIIHDWDDARCVTLLGNIRDAMSPDGRIMVVEKVVPAGIGYDFSKASDMLMLVLGDGGRERTEPEYEALFSRAGLHIHRRIVLPSLFDVFELRA